MKHWFWQHDWENVRVAHMEEMHYSPKTDKVTPIGRPSTLILQRCSCGKARTIEIDGHWTLADLGDAL